ncbi:hypothetical protein M0R89_06095 [Halorussus limi]|uniref:Uncharacterized protein n=1 Tax=Halorussus limi TaxID=2938695 RepID=A0A8U0HY06_9EURY|nr:hypothetical protein [Halorussus limi]UPV75633.1 hypothetical protein M0R89_06095 [Halorussus limi]
MSVDNFDSDGTGSQPSIIYAFDGGDEIRELSRSGYGEAGPSPGDVLERESTRSNPTERLPELELPGSRGLKEDDCGEEIPVFACNQCGKPKYLGRCCASPVCERDWPAAVKKKAIRLSGKLDALRRKVYASYDGQKNVDFNHVVASLPDFLVDSQNPMERAYLVLKTLLEENWQIEGFGAIYHPYRIKKEYRKDQYEHDGAEGNGDMTWSDVLSSEDPLEYVKYSPHFHLFFPAVRKSFDYLVAEAVANQSGWVFHRITQGNDSNISVENLEDLVHQVTYAFSHAGVNEWSADRAELTSVMKGKLHNMSVSDEIHAECLSHFCEAAPNLLGTQFADLDEATCDAEIAGGHTNRNQRPVKSEDESDETSSESPSAQKSGGVEESERSVKDDKCDEESEISSTDSSVNSSESSETDLTSIPDRDTQTSSTETSGSTPQQTPTESTPDGGKGASDSTPESPFVDRRVQCEGELVPIREAAELLDDSEWCAKAPHVSGLRTAVKEWSRRTNGEDHLRWVRAGQNRSPAVIQLY